jgi:hypothetical protein
MAHITSCRATRALPLLGLFTGASFLFTACTAQPDRPADSVATVANADTVPSTEGMIDVPGGRVWYRKLGSGPGTPLIALHGGLIPYHATFLVFSDYERNALRMAALMKQRVVCVFTHDSIGLGEDGPTHQPVEHAATLRLLPNMHVWRPCDTVETAAAWASASD